MIFLDTHESEELFCALSARTEVIRSELNERDIADVFWVGLDGTHQIEMKATGEILDNIEHVEGQLVRQYFSAQHSKLLVRGVVGMFPDKSIAEYVDHGKKGMHQRYNHKYYMPFASYRGWLNALDYVGIRVIEVPNMDVAVVAIMAEYEHSMREDHETLQGYYREKVVIKDKNPHVLALMYLSLAYGWKIGYEKSAALIDYFVTLGQVLRADQGELCTVKGIGPTIAKRIVENQWGEGIKPEFSLPEVQDA